MDKPIALKPCQHCAFTKRHLGTKIEIASVIAQLDHEGTTLHCHEYSTPTLCASHCAKKGIRGKRADKKGDLAPYYSHITKEQKLKSGLNGCNLFWRSEA